MSCFGEYRTLLTKMEVHKQGGGQPQLTSNHPAAQPKGLGFINGNHQHTGFTVNKIATNGTRGPQIQTEFTFIQPSDNQYSPGKCCGHKTVAVT